MATTKIKRGPGRPPKNRDVRRLQVDIAVSVRERVDRYAEINGQTVNGAVEKLLTLSLDKFERKSPK